MLRYNVAALVDNPPARSVTLPPIQVRATPEIAYRAALRALLKGIAAEVRAGVIPLYAADLQHRRLTGDAAADTWFTRLRAATAGLTATTAQAVGRAIVSEATKHTEAFLALFKRLFKIDVSATVRPDDLAEYVQTSIDRNTAMIRGFSDDVLQRIQRVVYENSVAGNSVAVLQKRLAEEFGLSEKRARLIARDQTGKLNADLNRLRQEQAGISSYRWDTSHDERVRPLHNSIDGIIYKWGEPTGAEKGLPPGQPINCRCHALGIVRFGRAVQ